ncbi:MAG TPA: FecR domain-containing protein [Vicinamibacterales bacterium]
MTNLRSRRGLHGKHLRAGVRLDRYTAPDANSVLAVNPYARPRRAARARKILPNQPRAIFIGVSRVGPWLVATVVLLLAATPTFAQQPAAGRIKVASGSVFIVRAGNLVPAQVGQVVYEADGLKTGADGRVGITLNDDTRVSLGPGSEVRLARFAYAPSAGQLGFVLEVVRGIAAYVSGRIAKLSPDSVRLETPAAIVGVRGTTLALRVVPE